MRVVRTPEGSLAIGPRLAGRGAWVCGAACAATATTRRAWQRALRAPVHTSAGDALVAELERLSVGKQVVREYGKPSMTRNRPGDGA